MRIPGGCHCGNVTFVFTLEPAPTEIAARACDCSFCVKHGGLWTSSPAATLDVAIADPDAVARYEFGTRTAVFHVCARCGVAPVATSEIEGRLYAVVSVHAFEGVPPAMIRPAPASFEGEDTASRLARRQRNWIRDVRFVATTHPKGEATRWPS